MNFKRPNGNVTIFLHWSKDDEISACDLSTIEKLRVWSDTLIVVKNLNKISEVSDLTGEVNSTITLSRPNSGYDFGGYKDAILFLEEFQNEIDSITILNNSMYFLHQNLNDLHEKIQLANLNVTAMTSSMEQNPHLQSYFLRFDAEVVSQKSFWNFWKSMTLSDDKDFVVQNYEIPLMDSFKKMGFTCGALFEYRNLVDFALSDPGTMILGRFRNSPGYQFLYDQLRAGNSVNPTHYLWRHLLEIGYPFLKKDIFSRFSNAGIGLEDWKNYVNDKKSQIEISESIPLGRFKI